MLYHCHKTIRETGGHFDSCAYVRAFPCAVLPWKATAIGSGGTSGKGMQSDTQIEMK